MGWSLLVLLFCIYYGQCIIVSMEESLLVSYTRDVSCGPPSQECTVMVRNPIRCEPKQVKDGTACTEGTCWGGVCISNCMNATLCPTGLGCYGGKSGGCQYSSIVIHGAVSLELNETEMDDTANKHLFTALRLDIAILYRVRVVQSQITQVTVPKITLSRAPTAPTSPTAPTQVPTEVKAFLFHYDIIMTLNATAEQLIQTFNQAKNGKNGLPHTNKALQALISKDSTGRSHQQHGTTTINSNHKQSSKMFYRLIQPKIVDSCAATGKNICGDSVYTRGKCVGPGGNPLCLCEAKLKPSHTLCERPCSSATVHKCVTSALSESRWRNCQTAMSHGVMSCVCVQALVQCYQDQGTNCWNATKATCCSLKASYKNDCKLSCLDVDCDNDGTSDEASNCKTCKIPDNSCSETLVCNKANNYTCQVQKYKSIGTKCTILKPAPPTASLPPSPSSSSPPPSHSMNALAPSPPSDPHADHTSGNLITVHGRCFNGTCRDTDVEGGLCTHIRCDDMGPAPPPSHHLYYIQTPPAVPGSDVSLQCTSYVCNNLTLLCEQVYVSEGQSCADQSGDEFPKALICRRGSCLSEGDDKGGGLIGLIFGLSIGGILLVIIIGGSLVLHHHYSTRHQEAQRSPTRDRSGKNGENKNGSNTSNSSNSGSNRGSRDGRDHRTHKKHRKHKHSNKGVMQDAELRDVVAPSGRDDRDDEWSDGDESILADGGIKKQEVLNNLKNQNGFEFRRVNNHGCPLSETSPRDQPANGSGPAENSPKANGRHCVCGKDDLPVLRESVSLNGITNSNSSGDSNSGADAHKLDGRAFENPFSAPYGKSSNEAISTI